MKAAKVVMVVGVGILLAWAAAYYWTKRSLERVDFGPLSELLETAVAEAFVVPASPQAKPEVDGPFLETWVRALEIGTNVGRLGVDEPLPPTSKQIGGLRPGHQLDAWGRPFCLVRVDARVVVISAGPKPSLTRCEELLPPRAEIQAMQQGLLYSFPSGSLVLVVGRARS